MNREKTTSSATVATGFKLWDKDQPLYLRLWGLLVILISISMMLPS